VVGPWGVGDAPAVFLAAWLILYEQDEFTGFGVVCDRKLAANERNNSARMVAQVLLSSHGMNINHEAIQKDLKIHCLSEISFKRSSEGRVNGKIGKGWNLLRGFLGRFTSYSLSVPERNRSWHWRSTLWLD
jgi:hypothetical protein